MKDYDQDVVVIGAGPAGLAAAIRLRWVKGYHPIPLSVALVDPEPPGGLAAMGGCILTGPSWAMNAEGILGPLLSDARALAIPQITERAVGLERLAGGMLGVRLASGRRLSCHAAIVATGFRALHGEAARFGDRLHLTYKGYAFFPELIGHAARDAAGRGLVIIGRRETLDLVPLLAPVAAEAGGITLALQPPVGAAGPLPPGIDLRVGHTHAYRGDGPLTGVAFTPAGAGGPPIPIPCGAALVDYHAFERHPEVWDRGPLPVPRRGDGFIKVDASLATPAEGVYAAGDVTGRYASTAMAIGDGVCAAFSAYQYVFQRKFGVQPSLFAYAASGASPAAFADPSRGERPFTLPAEGRIRPLLPAEDRRMREAEGAPLAEALAAPPDAPWTVAALRARMGEDAAERALFRGMHRRLLTLHHAPQPFVKPI